MKLIRESVYLQSVYLHPAFEEKIKKIIKNPQK